MPTEREWHLETSSFLQQVPLRVSCRPENPSAPLILYCHGMSEDPEASLRAWPSLTALPAHLVAPAGPYPHEVRGEAGIRIGHAWYLYDGESSLFRETVETALPWVIGTLTRLEERWGLRPRYRAVVGFSQGAYFGYALALRHQSLFSHLVAVAGRLREDFVAEALSRPGKLRSLILHGEKDRAVAPEASRRSLETLVRAGYTARLQWLPGGHGLRDDRDAAATRWLRREWGLEANP